MSDVAERAPAAAKREEASIFAPFRHRLFQRVWVASLVSSFGTLIQGVGAAWAMTQLTPSADLVALVQTASFIPMMLLSLASGAIADMCDRRIVGLASLGIGIVSAAGLSLCSFFGLLTPVTLLAFCFAIGTGMALFGPAWQASVSEQVPPDILPQAISLNSISFNIARSLGPALGGALVAAFGALAAFVVNVFCYIPMFVVLFLWRRAKTAPRLPPESLGRAIISGVRYVTHSPPIRTVLTRTLLVSVIGGVAPVLMPLVARDLVQGGALTYGVLLGAFGLGAVIGALNMSTLRARFVIEHLVIACMVLIALSTITVSFSRSLPLSMLALLCNGMGWMVSIASHNIEIQMAAPRWVAGRTLALFQASTAGGVAVAGVIWGHVAEWYGTPTAFLAAGIAMLGVPILALWLRLPGGERVEDAREERAAPTVTLKLTPRSGPIVIEFEYRVNAADAREFYTAMLEQQRARQRNGGYGWSISRDIAEPDLWTERFHCPTWHDYLRQRSRATQAERELENRIRGLHQGPNPPVVRRMLERPFGSVRWREETPDHGEEHAGPITGPTGP